LAATVAFGGIDVIDARIQQGPENGRIHRSAAADIGDIETRAAQGSEFPDPGCCWRRWLLRRTHWILGREHHAHETKA